MTRADVLVVLGEPVDLLPNPGLPWRNYIPMVEPDADPATVGRMLHFGNTRLHAMVFLHADGLVMATTSIDRRPSGILTELTRLLGL